MPNCISCVYSSDEVFTTISRSYVRCEYYDIETQTDQSCEHHRYEDEEDIEYED